MTEERLREIRERLAVNDQDRTEGAYDPLPSDGPLEMAERRGAAVGTVFRLLDIAHELLVEVDRLTEANAIACGEWQGWLDAADAAGWPHDSQGDRERLRRCRR